MSRIFYDLMKKIFSITLKTSKEYLKVGSSFEFSNFLSLCVFVPLRHFSPKILLLALPQKCMFCDMYSLGLSVTWL